jgi:diaminopimelate epimerase
VRFVHEQGLTDKREIRVETRTGLIAPRLEADGQVTVDMGAPRFRAGRDSFVTSDSGAAVQPLDVEGPDGRDQRRLDGQSARGAGGGRCRCRAGGRQGPLIESHPRFPRRVNAGFMQVVDRHAIRLRVYERGTGETLACGTGACAAVVAGIRRGLLDSPVRVATRGGELSIAWAGDRGGQYAPVLMTGPAATVFSAEIELPDNL